MNKLTAMKLNNLYIRYIEKCEGVCVCVRVCVILKRDRYRDMHVYPMLHNFVCSHVDSTLSQQKPQN